MLWYNLSLEKGGTILKEYRVRNLPISNLKWVSGRLRLLFKKPIRKESLLLAGPILYFLVFVLILQGRPSPLPREHSSALENQQDSSAPIVEETVVEEASDSTIEDAEPPPSYENSVEITIEKGDNLFDILRRNGLSPSQIHELVAVSKPIHNLGRLRRGQTLMLTFDTRDARILRFETDIDGENRLIAQLDGEELRARKEAIEFDIYHEVVSGTINDSLFLAADRVGLAPPMILDLAEIFAWDIDFSVDIWAEDTFRILFEKKYLNGNFASNGRILAAEIVSRGHPFAAYYFQDSDGRTDYYDAEGHSLRKAFLKSPLNYKYISSRFSRSRLHPILKIYRPHLGVDYAAPTGTPIRTVGDGTIVYAGWKNGYGRYVKIRHNQTYSTTYGHLQRFGKGIKSGKRVTQGQVIGYVGSSGLATGPHLDFRMAKNGKFINPLTTNIPDADPVRDEDLPAFSKIVAEFARELGQRDLDTTI
ncbi:MAG: hypothetical protein C4532_03810 [Candidatus Abyssobacteria bacterium SURF_17]|uniref:LysM domain-containing protein n=1 Tax=Candidatus Abyssobacteria bacterium SURF_17 TaxID=2093361 RepID=A0A419F5R9_9BACT|nr:MAG: hypothetical protein C4532_03810 [Candidatus Abyssubacteria bacterium SURF_17]